MLLRILAPTGNEMLLAMQNHSMTEQMEMLNEKFEKLRGDLMRLDDVCSDSYRNWGEGVS